MQRKGIPKLGGYVNRKHGEEEQEEGQGEDICEYSQTVMELPQTLLPHISKDQRNNLVGGATVG